MQLNFRNHPTYINQFAKKFKETQMQKPKTLYTTAIEPSKQKKKGYFLGFLAASAITGVITNISKITSLTFQNLFTKVKGLPDFNDEIINASNEMLKDTGLDKKGFKALFIDSANITEATEIITKESSIKPFQFLRKILFKKLPESFKLGMKLGKNLVHESFAQTIIEGKNALLSRKTKTALAGKLNPGFIFHEIGHGVSLQNPIGKLLQKHGRQLPFFASIIGGITLFTTPKNKQQTTEKETFWQKTKNFADKNIGLITLGAFIPMIIDEISASTIGLKHAKKHIENIKPIKKLYGLAFSSYLVIAGLSSISIALANKAQNKIVEARTKKANS